MRFTLNQYPAAIAQAAQAVNEIDHRINEIRYHMNKMDGNAEMVVAFDVTLKNDHQRKARRFEVLQINPEYEKATKSLNRLTTDRANALAMLEQLRNEFNLDDRATGRHGFPRDGGLVGVNSIPLAPLRRGDKIQSPPF
jgi:hypothetical protein